MLLHSKLSQWWCPCLILHIYSLFPHLCLPATSGHALLCPPLEIAIFFHKLTFLTTGLVLGMGNYFKPSQIESFSWFLELEQEVRVFSSWMGRQEFADSPQSLGRESWFSREEIKANLQKEAKLTKIILIVFEPLVLVSETSPLPKFPSSPAFQKAFVRVSWFLLERGQTLESDNPAFPAPSQPYLFSKFSVESCFLPDARLFLPSVVFLQLFPYLEWPLASSLCSTNSGLSSRSTSRSISSIKTLLDWSFPSLNYCSPYLPSFCHAVWNIFISLPCSLWCFLCQRIVGLAYYLFIWWLR